MTGPEHYRIAQHLILAITKPSSINPDVRILREVVSADVIAVAQVHATLALAAAVALGSRERDGDHDPDGMDPSDRHAWEAVASAGRPCPCGEGTDGDCPGAWRGCDWHNAGPEPHEYDPGPEIDDEGGMSEYRHSPVRDQEVAW